MNPLTLLAVICFLFGGALVFASLSFSEVADVLKFRYMPGKRWRSLMAGACLWAWLGIFTYFVSRLVLCVSTGH